MPSLPEGAAAAAAAAGGLSFSMASDETAGDMDASEVPEGLLTRDTRNLKYHTKDQLICIFRMRVRAIWSYVRG